MYFSVLTKQYTGRLNSIFTVLYVTLLLGGDQVFGRMEALVEKKDDEEGHTVFGYTGRIGSTYILSITVL